MENLYKDFRKRMLIIEDFVGERIYDGNKTDNDIQETAWVVTDDMDVFVGSIARNIEINIGDSIY